MALNTPIGLTPASFDNMITGAGAGYTELDERKQSGRRNGRIKSFSVGQSGKQFERTNNRSKYKQCVCLCLTQRKRTDGPVEVL